MLYRIQRWLLELPKIIKAIKWRYFYEAILYSFRASEIKLKYMHDACYFPNNMLKTLILHTNLKSICVNAIGDKSNTIGGGSYGR